MLKLCDLVVQVGCGKCLVKGGLPGCLGGGRRQRGERGGEGEGCTHYAVRLLVHAARATRQNPAAGYAYLEDVSGVVWRVT